MLHVDKVDSLQAETLCITANRLEARTCYKIVLRFFHSNGTHAAYAVFQADCLGCIDLARDAPIRGTYHDVDPMGLFSSVLPTQDIKFGSSVRCTKSEPYYYTLVLFNDFGKKLDEINLKRRWLHPLISRIEVREPEQKLYGYLYKPPGAGPFPAIIDIQGAGGTMLEMIPTFFASQGFLVLTFMYFQHEDLPDAIADVDAAFFQKPIDLLLDLPYSNGRLGVFGPSFGGLTANFLATKYPQISAVIAVNAFESFCRDELVMKENGAPIECARIDEGGAVWRNGVLGTAPCFRELYENLKPEHKLPWARVAKSTAFRVIGGMDDMVMDSVQCARHLHKDLTDNGLYVEMDLVASGHSLLPPFYPHIPFLYNKFQGLMWAYGGHSVLQEKSQRTVWARNVEFYKRFLGCPPKIPDWSREKEVTMPSRSRL
ncbi:unnamed protein product [Caenorhabditis sp. 36 PRJEB53466]|nr:unnamed protein product [Caenorhabditis sp. 36 PRJEB53466]